MGQLRSGHVAASSFFWKGCFLSMKIESIENSTLLSYPPTHQTIFIFDGSCSIVYASVPSSHLLYKAVEERTVEFSGTVGFLDSFHEDLKETLVSGRNRHGFLTFSTTSGNGVFSYTLIGADCPIVQQPTATAIFNLTNTEEKLILQDFRENVHEIFESYLYPVCLCEVENGDIIFNNSAYLRHFPQENGCRQVFCWATFAKFRKTFAHFRDWQSIPFSYRHTDDFITAGRFSAGTLKMGGQTYLIFTFSIQPECPEGRFYSTDDIVQSLETQFSRFAASLGHEVGNVLTVLSGNLQLMDEQNAFADHQDTYAEMLAELQRSIQLTTNMRKNFDKPQSPKPEYLEDIVGGMQRILIHQAANFGVQVSFCCQRTSPILIDQNEIRQVLLNLFKNAYESMENGGTIAIGVIKTSQEVALSIRDQGHGIPPHVAANIGTPYLSTKKNGTGLGLSICYDKVHANGGRIEFESDCKGTCFRIIFPLHDYHR
jgi:two-component sensor histidine kinase